MWWAYTQTGIVYNQTCDKWQTYFTSKLQAKKTKPIESFSQELLQLLQVGNGFQVRRTLFFTNGSIEIGADPTMRVTQLKLHYQ